MDMVNYSYGHAYAYTYAYTHIHPCDYMVIPPGGVGGQNPSPGYSPS